MRAKCSSPSKLHLGYAQLQTLEPLAQGHIRGPQRTRELAGMDENSGFNAFLGSADLSLDADWLDVFIAVARDGFFLSQLGSKV
jgi:hypothetical protein